MHNIILNMNRLCNSFYNWTTRKDWITRNSKIRPIIYTVSGPCRARCGVGFNILHFLFLYCNTVYMSLYAINYKNHKMLGQRRGALLSEVQLVQNSFCLSDDWALDNNPTVKWITLMCSRLGFARFEFP